MISQIKSMVHCSFLEMFLLLFSPVSSVAVTEDDADETVMPGIWLWRAAKVKVRKIVSLSGYSVLMQIYRSVSKTPADGS